MSAVDPTSPATLDAATLRDLLDSGRGPRILDVRTPAEFETSHIPGAYNVPLDLLREHRAELGILAWQATNAPTSQGKTRWDLERQVRLIGGSIVLASVLASIAVPGAQWIAAAMGAGLTVAALTNTCAMGMLLAKLPYNRGASCDLDTIISQLRDTTPTGGRS